MRFYYINEGARQGPVPVFQLRELVKDGVLTRESKVWHDGMTEWLPLKDVDTAGLRDVDFDGGDPKESDEGPPLPPASFDAPTDEKKTVVVARPAKLSARVMARLVDFTIWQLILLIIVWVTPLTITEFLISDASIFMIGAMTIGLETLSLHLYGTTPGKRLMGIELVLLNREGFPLGMALRRTFEVFVFGCGMMILPLTLLCGILNWFVARKIGGAIWDRKLGIFAADKGTSISRWAMAVGVLLLINIATSAIPGMDDAINYMLEQFRSKGE